MIILDREAGEGTKDDFYQGLTLRHPSAAFTRSSSVILPDYNTSEALHWKTISEPVPPKRPKVNPTIWKAAAYAFAIYLFLSLVIIVPLAVVKMKKQPKDQYSNLDSFWDDIENANPPSLLQLASSGTPIIDFNKTCNVWSTAPSETMARARFYLPPNGLVALRSNATYSPTKPMSIVGDLLVEMNTDLNEKNLVFDLGLSYSSYNVFKQTNICFSRTGSNRGLSIYVPTLLTLDDRLVFNITVLLPQVKSTIDNFVTYLPLLAQTFGELGTRITFNKMTLEGAAQPIYSKFLQAKKISIKNLAAPIEGAFNVTGSLALDTVKGPVTSNITLTQPQYPTRPTLLDIGTGDSVINAYVVLDSSRLAMPPRAPAFGVQVNNFNGPMNMTIAYSENTPNTTMQFTAQNNLAPTILTLDPRYEGTFTARSKLDQILVHSFMASSDGMTDAQQSWTLEYDIQKDDFVSGWAGWGMRPMRGRRPPGSTIDITSALSPVFLNFGSDSE